jgi:uncharacterized protein (DUF433 family)/predicted nuclease of predicted toxin-antitoxin system
MLLGHLLASSTGQHRSDLAERKTSSVFGRSGKSRVGRGCGNKQPATLIRYQPLKHVRPRDVDSGLELPISGMKMRRRAILELIGSGATADDIVHACPHLTREDVTAAVRFAASDMRDASVFEVEIAHWSSANSLFLQDENIHPEVSAILIGRGISVTTVRSAGLAGASERAILKRALDEGQVVLSHDPDFGKLAIAARQPVHGLVYLRPGHMLPELTTGTLIAVLNANFDLFLPFLAVAVRAGDRVRIRVRPVLTGHS